MKELVVAVVGFSKREYQRMRKKIKEQQLPISLLYGGNIEEGSNAQKHAKKCCKKADLIIWRPRYSRHFNSGFYPNNQIKQIRGGFSSAFSYLETVSRAA